MELGLNLWEISIFSLSFKLPNSFYLLTYSQQNKFHKWKLYNFFYWYYLSVVLWNKYRQIASKLIQSEQGCMRFPNGATFSSRIRPNFFRYSEDLILINLYFWPRLAFSLFFFYNTLIWYQTKPNVCLILFSSSWFVTS